ncbi:hypothetical protein PYW08_011242 [Mythimna loreyi]|uniref:Uncharacterized protein n=1 Tax=Mythimna loreyi TaxID=667449 RepID=A0ACC2Q2R5_9NEOP|nr:hypothetical protein PYW08_011242 [Mythimna loreyi]
MLRVGTYTPRRDATLHAHFIRVTQNRTLFITRKDTHLIVRIRCSMQRSPRDALWRSAVQRCITGPCGVILLCASQRYNASRGAARKHWPLPASSRRVSVCTDPKVV